MRWMLMTCSPPAMPRGRSSSSVRPDASPASGCRSTSLCQTRKRSRCPPWSSRHGPRLALPVLSICGAAGVSQMRRAVAGAAVEAAGDCSRSSVSSSLPEASIAARSTRGAVSLSPGFGRLPLPLSPGRIRTPVAGSLCTGTVW